MWVYGYDVETKAVFTVGGKWSPRPSPDESVKHEGDVGGVFLTGKGWFVMNSVWSASK